MDDELGVVDCAVVVEVVDVVSVVDERVVLVVEWTDLLIVTATAAVLEVAGHSST